MKHLTNFAEATALLIVAVFFVLPEIYYSIKKGVKV